MIRVEIEDWTKIKVDQIKDKGHKWNFDQYRDMVS